jgi:ABC-type Zn uptake system ZnuABC Zn-binding protein ZnuA
MKRAGRLALWLGLMLGLTGLWLLAGAGCGSTPDPWKDKGGPPRVLVTFPPLASFVKAIGGDDVGVISLCEKIGPHSYNFNSEDAIKLAGADLFVWNGLGLDDHFALKMKSNAGNAKVRFLDLGENLDASSRIKDPNFVPGQKHEHDESGACCGGHGPYDPHIWLGVPQAVKMVELLRDDLKTVDSARSASYERRSAEYVNQLNTLLAEGRKQLKDFKVPIVSSHEAMRYFASQFDLHIVGSLQGLDGQDTDSQKLRDLVKRCQDHRRILVTVEPQYPTTIADVLRRQLKDAEVILVELDPMETCTDAGAVDGEWYLKKMRQNIEALARHAK